MQDGIALNTADMDSARLEKARQLQRRASGEFLTEKQRQQAKKAAQEFEGLFISMMMKSMRETTGKDTLTGGGRGEEIFRSMLDDQYVAETVKRGGFGLARQIEKDIIKQESRKVTRTVDRKG
ncbi:MAG TPA: rod-binding protein [Deltaproteobacteria bacterium]|nr:rod-binding protein [Deltaproteobacteria bacterium]HQB37948.1 rod-binding protein [Deltaproteobacteria bacterium]